MRRIVTVGTFFILLLPLTASAQSIEGVWRAAEVVIGGGPDEGRHTTDVQPSLYFFTKSHYSVMLVHGWEPRPMLSENPTDEERGKVTGTPVGCACGDGVIDWSRVIKLCREAKQDIVLSVECGTVEQAERSIRHLKSLV